MTNNKHLIIGAGPAGLIAGLELRDRGIDFEIVEKSDRIGGIWDIDRNDTPIYNSTHFISSKTLSAFSRYPMPDHFPDYPSHKKIFSYLTAFVKEYDLEKHISFNTSVDEVHRAGEIWEASFSDGQTKKYHSVICATGLTWHPNMPNIEGKFSGEAMHSMSYKDPAIFKDKNVLIIGAGNSGCDIACDAAQSAKRTFISMRRGYYFLPKYIFGIPADVYNHKSPLPEWLDKPISKFVLNRILVGDLTKYGLPKPDHDLLTSHPIMNTQILHHLGHGDLEVKPNVKKLDENQVIFEDGSSERIDLIIYATGYQRQYPFLQAELASSSEAIGRIDLSMEIFHRQLERLYFMGGIELAGGAFPILEQQAKLIAQYAETVLKHPAQAADFKQKKIDQLVNVRGNHKYIDSLRHKYYVHEDTYKKELQKAMKMLK